MKEIIYPKVEWDTPNTKNTCLSCGGEMRFGCIPCPEGRMGCLVLHYGYRCLKCGKIFQDS